MCRFKDNGHIFICTRRYVVHLTFLTVSKTLRMTLHSYSVIRELNRPETLAGLSQTVVCVTFNLIRFFNPEKWTIQSVKKSEQKNTFNNFFNWKKKFKTWFKARQDRENDWRKSVRNIDLSRMNKKEKEIQSTCFKVIHTPTQVWGDGKHRSKRSTAVNSHTCRSRKMS